MTTTDEHVDIAVRARSAATAWLNTFLATSQDDARPVLYRTMSVEFFEAGVQCIATDGTALFRSWVPVRLGDDWPELDEAPVRAVTVMDVQGFGLSFMHSLLRVTSDEGRASDDLSLEVLPMDEGATLALGQEFATERLVLRACGQRIDLQLMEDSYPNWRALKLDRVDVERVDGLLVAPRLLAMVGKIKGVGTVGLSFVEAGRRVDFVARGAEAEVRGIIMSMRREAEG